MFEIFKTVKYLSCFKTVKNIFINLIDIMAKIDEKQTIFLNNYSKNSIS